MSTPATANAIDEMPADAEAAENSSSLWRRPPANCLKSLETAYLNMIVSSASSA